jgi:hypothetical protein
MSTAQPTTPRAAADGTRGSNGSLELLLDTRPGDAGREANRPVRRRQLANHLESIGAPDALALSDALLCCTGAEMLVEPSPAGKLGFVIEIAVAGRAAYGDEPDFGNWEIKSSFLPIADGAAMNLLAWKAPESDTKPLHPLKTTRHGRPMIAAVAPDEPGLHLDAGILTARTATGEVVWSRPLATIHDAVRRKLSNVLQVNVESCPRGENTLLRITEIRVMWDLSTAQLETQLMAGAAGLLVKRRRFAIATSRSRLQDLYRNVVHVTVSDETPTGTLLLTTVRAT